MIIVTNDNTLNKRLLMEPVVSLLSKIVYNIVNCRFPYRFRIFTLLFIRFRANLTIG